MSASREDYIRYKMQRSNEVFDDALLLAANGRWNSAMNRLYYSMLYKHRIKAETHNGTKTSFFFHFVKNEIVEREFGKLYANLFDWRQESDHADFAEFDEETINVLLERVKQFNHTISRLLDE